MNLYDEPQKIYVDDNRTARSVLIEIDLSKPLTLLEMINLVRSQIESLPPETEITVYFVCGRECRGSDIGLFIDYLQTIENPVSVVVRGYVHFDFVKLLFSFPTVSVSSNLKLVYSKVKLHEGLVQMMANREIMQKFMSNFISSYHKLEEGTILDVSDLNSIGIKLNQF